MEVPEKPQRKNEAVSPVFMQRMPASCTPLTCWCGVWRWQGSVVPCTCAHAPTWAGLPLLASPIGTRPGSTKANMIRIRVCPPAIRSWLDSVILYRGMFARPSVNLRLLDWRLAAASCFFCCFAPGSTGLAWRFSNRRWFSSLTPGNAPVRFLTGSLRMKQLTN